MMASGNPGFEAPSVPPPSYVPPMLSNEPPPEYQNTYDNQQTLGQENQTMPEKSPLPDTSPYPMQPGYPNQQYTYYQPDPQGYPPYNPAGHYPGIQQPYSPQMTVIQRDPNQPPPKETSAKDIGALVFSICACLFFFWPLGIFAIVFSGMALSYRGRIGSDDRADQYTKYSLILSSIATGIGIVIIISLIIVACTA
ncbi:uncharacterized protein [Ptychodera flava]|uniref:uncharacterized protein n=1 Tax=Ptychodera flava TaxID=63121 RepID=UPI00396A58D8